MHISTREHAYIANSITIFVENFYCSLVSLLFMEHKLGIFKTILVLQS